MTSLAGADDLLEHGELAAEVRTELRVATAEPVGDVVALLRDALDAVLGVHVLRVARQRPRLGQLDGGGPDREAEPPQVDADVDDRGHVARQELHEGEVLRVGAVLGPQVVGVDHVAAATLDLALPVVVEHRALPRRRPAEQDDQGDLGAFGAQVGDHLHAVLPVPAVVSAAELFAARGGEPGGEGRGGRGRRPEQSGGDGAVTRARRGGDDRHHGQTGSRGGDRRRSGREPKAAAAERATSRRHPGRRRCSGS